MRELQVHYSKKYDAASAQLAWAEGGVQAWGAPSYSLGLKMGSFGPIGPHSASRGYRNPACPI